MQRSLIKLFFISSFALISLAANAQHETEKILTIDEMFRLIDENSKSIRVSQAALDQATEAVKAAKSERLPSLDASLSASYLGNGYIMDRNFSNGSSAPMPHYGNNFALEASQVIYGGGAINSGIESAKLGRQIAGLSMEDNRQNLRFTLLGYYLELYKLNNQRTVYLKNIEQTELLVAQIRARHAEGIALANDITRYELQLQQLYLALTETQSNISLYNNYLITTLALPEETIIVPDSTLLSVHIPDTSERDWQQLAQDSQHQIKIANLSVGLGREQERITRAERLPKIALVASNHMDGPITIEVPAINKNFNYWYVGIGIQYNFGSLWKSGRKSRVNRYATIQAERHLELVQEETDIAVNSAYVMLKQAYQQLLTQQQSVELAIQNYGVINNRYLNDLALLTDMIDASNSQLSAELSLVNSRINVLYSYYKLQRVSGTL